MMGGGGQRRPPPSPPARQCASWRPMRTGAMQQDDAAQGEGCPLMRRGRRGPRFKQASLPRDRGPCRKRGGFSPPNEDFKLWSVRYLTRETPPTSLGLYVHICSVPPPARPLTDSTRWSVDPCRHPAGSSPPFFRKRTTDEGPGLGLNGEKKTSGSEAPAPARFKASPHRGARGARRCGEDCLETSAKQAAQRFIWDLELREITL